VFYATDHAYAIAVLVFVCLLQRLGVSGDADLVLLHLPLPSQLVSKLRDQGVLTVAVLALPYVDDPYYRHCLVKLRTFQLIEYDRVVYIDADAIPLRCLDDLLVLPLDGPLAAPRAYWLPQPCWCTGLLVVRPSLANWNRVSRHFNSASGNLLFDMDIINNEYAGEITTLPADTFCLNSEWEDADRPGFFGNPSDTYSRVGVVHFTALGKPWFYPIERVRRLRPKAHPIFYELWDTWRKTRDEIFLASDGGNTQHHADC
jgi:alpha-N-acetylglucosamine transferase